MVGRHPEDDKGGGGLPPCSRGTAGPPGGNPPRLARYAIFIFYLTF
ncbi:hypothetical protein HMPREF3150_04390 [Pseudomonas aeruginosa]|nr:hypothetical protein HMPREF3150_04390 [Pseudomonas aeruginosa]